MGSFSRREFIAASAALAALGGGCSRRAGGQTTITAKGSDTLVILAQKWAEVYISRHSGVKIQVTGGGTGTGFAALVNRTTDLCNASRRIKAAEQFNCVRAFNARAVEYAVCLDGLAVYVNDSNPLRELTVAQVRDFFTGRTQRWSEVGGSDEQVRLYSRENSSGTYEFFKDHVLQGKDFAPDAQTMPGTASVLQAVGKDPTGIGYGGAAYGSGARALSIKRDESSPAYEPTEENVLSGRYPIWRELYMYVNPAADKGPIREYLDWIRSDEGQSVVKEMAYFPLPMDKRQRPA